MKSDTVCIPILCGRLCVSLLAGWLFIALPVWAETPVITSLSPDSATAAGAPFTLSVYGSDFVSGATVYWNGSARTTAFIRDTKLTASIPASDVASLGTATITVSNSSAGGGTSNSLAFAITTSPVPFVTSLLPSYAPAGSSGFTLTVVGGHFTTGSIVYWNGHPRTTGFFSSGTLEATIPTSSISEPGTADVWVANPAPAAARSNTLVFEIKPTASTPVITSLQPEAVAAGSRPFNLTVRGSNFTATCVVLWDGAARATTFIDSSTLWATILESDVEQTGTASVTVRETGPGGGLSGEATLTIEAFSKLYFPQVAAGGGYTTVITITNTGTQTAAGNLVLTDQAGNPFHIILSETQAGGQSASAGEPHPATGSTFGITIPPGATRTYTVAPLSALEPQQSGWARVETSGGTLGGVATFQYRPGGTLQAVAGVMASSPIEFATIPVDNDDSQRRYAGFAVANQGTEDIAIDVELLDAGGTPYESISPASLNPLRGNNQVALFLHQLTPALVNFKGSMVLVPRDGRKVTVVALVLYEGLLTVVPVIPEKPPGVGSIR